MKFRMWYVSMGLAAALVFGGMLYFGSILCVPMSNNPCIPFK